MAVIDPEHFNDEMEQWLKNEWTFQQSMFVQLAGREYDVFNSFDELEEKINCALTICLGEDDESAQFSNTSKKLLEKMKSVTCNNRYYLSLAYISCKLSVEKKLEFRFVVLKTKNDSGSVFFDLASRRYESWLDFLENNELPQCYMMYPKYGKYSGHGQICKVVCEKSAALSLKSMFKKSCDVVCGVASVVAMGVLMTNPVTAPVLLTASACTAVTGAYSVGSGIARLVDIESRGDGICISNAESNFVIADIALSAVGSIGMGASAGLRGVAARSGMALSKGSLALELADNVGNIARTAGAAHSIFNLATAYNNYRQKKFTDEDRKKLTKILLFAFNIVVSEDVAKGISELIKDLNFSDVIYRLYCHENKVFSKYKFVTKYVSWCKTISKEMFLPKYPHSNLENVRREADNVSKTLYILEQNNMKAFQLYYKLHAELKSLFDSVNVCAKDAEYMIIEHFGGDLFTKFSDTCFWKGSNSKSYLQDVPFEFKIKMLTEVVELIDQSVRLQILHAPDYDKIVDWKQLLFKTLICLIGKHEVRSFHYAILKMEYFCRSFLKYSSKTKEHFHYNAFRYTLTGHKEEAFFRNEVNIEGDISKYIFNECLNALKREVEILRDEYDDLYENLYENLIYDNLDGIIYQFCIPQHPHALSDEEYYKLLEKMTGLDKRRKRFTADNSAVDTYFNNTAVIRSIDPNEKVVCVYYDFDDKNNLKGIIY